MGSIAIPQGATLQPLQAQSGSLPIPQGATFEALPQPGEMTNDVGNKVIVPQPREAFADTMRRAAAYGQTVTPEQLSAEERTMPRKAGQAMLSSLLIGAGGAAGLAGAGEAGAAVGAAGSRAVDAIQAMAKAHPYAAKLVSRALEGAAASAGGTTAYKWMKDLLPD